MDVNVNIPDIHYFFASKRTNGLKEVIHIFLHFVFCMHEFQQNSSIIDFNECI